MPPDGMWFVGVKAIVTGTEDFAAKRSDNAMEKNTSKTRCPKVHRSALAKYRIPPEITLPPAKIATLPKDVAEK